MDVITETSLEALIQRATDPRNKSADIAAIDAFCGIIKKEPDGASVATRLIASKIQSPEEWEALQGLSVLEACMKNCGPSFHSEIGKFRFLNEMIKLVSPKFFGARTPLPVRNQVLKLMYSWTLHYPKEPKIKEAYDMLKKQGVINTNEFELTNEESKASSTPQKSHPLFQDEEKVRLLQKLLHSKNPDDLQAANRLIKSMVKEDERRVEIKSKKVSEIETVKNNVRLLSEMLDSYRPNQASTEEIELIKELHQGCERLRPSIFRIAADTQDNDDILSQVLSVSDELGNVLDKYTTIMVLGQKFDKVKSSSGDSKQISSLLDLSSPVDESVPQKELKNSDLLSKPLCVLDMNPIDLDISGPISTGLPSTNHSNATDNVNSHLDALDEIFASLDSQPNTIMPVLSNSVLKSHEDAKPAEKSKFGNADKKSKIQAFQELDILGKTLMQKCKMDSGLATKSPEKTVENPSEKPKEASNEKELKLEDPSPVVKNPSENSDDDVMMDLGEVAAASEQTIVSKSTDSDTAPKQEVKPLTDVSVTLESIKPSLIPPISVIQDKNGISVTLFVAKDTPREDVTVFVITTVSKNESSVTNYLLQAVVPKGCKMKLQPPSGSELPAHNPFLPPSAITQIMLIANPNNLDVALKCMISFTVDDETITEMGEVERLPMIT